MQDDRIRNEETGELIRFNSMIDALNYMTEKGWEFVQAYVITDGRLLKNRLIEIKQGIYNRNFL